MSDFTCSNCKRTFEKGWTDEEAAAESRKLFGSILARAPQDVLCDDCFKDFMSWFQEQGVTLPK